MRAERIGGGRRGDGDRKVALVAEVGLRSGGATTRAAAAAAAAAGEATKRHRFGGRFYCQTMERGRRKTMKRFSCLRNEREMIRAC